MIERKKSLTSIFIFCRKVVPFSGSGMERVMRERSEKNGFSGILAVSYKCIMNRLLYGIRRLPRPVGQILKRSPRERERAGSK